LGNLYQKFAKDVIVIGITNILVALSSLILLSLITKTTGAYDYGIWVQVQVTINLVLGLAGIGLPFALVRFLPAKTRKEEIQDDFYSIFYLVFLVTFALSIVLIAFADLIAGAFFNGATDIVRITGLIILVGSLNSVFLATFRAFQQTKKYALFHIAGPYGQIALIACLILNGYGIVAIVLAALVINLVLFITMFFVIRAQIGINWPRFSRIKDYLSFGLPMIPWNLSMWVMSGSTRYVIGFFLGLAAVGVYSAASSMGQIMFMLSGILSFVLTPAISKLYDEGKQEDVKKHLSFSLKYLLALAIPFVFGAAILAKPVLKLLSTAAIADEGYLIVPLVAFNALPWCVYAVEAQVLVMLKKTKIIAISWAIAATVNFLLNVISIPLIGIMGAALTSVIANIIATGIIIYHCRKEFPFDVDWKFIIKSLIASTIMALAIWSISPKYNMTTVIAIIAGVAIYGVALILLKGFKKEEFAFFKWLIIGKLRGK
jgi:O-antigen/teichoic acid export membrane protein